MTPPSDRAAQNRRAVRIVWLCLLIGPAPELSGWLLRRWPFQFWTVLIVVGLGGLWWAVYILTGGRHER